MIVRVLLFLLLCSAAKAQTSQKNDDANTRSPDGRPTVGSIPKFDHAPGSQRSIPSSNAVPGNGESAKEQ